MKAIGFSNKYYTLWDISEEVIYKQVGDAHIPVGSKTFYRYLQNLSLDLDTAIDKAVMLGCTNTVVDENLNGKIRSFSSKKMYDFADHQFRFGKYQYLDIRECDDVKYLTWYFSETHNQIAAERVVALDKNYVLFDGQLKSKEEVDGIEKSIRAFEKIYSGQVVLTAVSNFQVTDGYFINEDGSYDEDPQPERYYVVNVIFETTDEDLLYLSNIPKYKYGVSVEVREHDSLNLEYKSWGGYEWYAPKHKNSFKGTKFTFLNRRSIKL